MTEDNFNLRELKGYIIGLEMELSVLYLDLHSVEKELEISKFLLTEIEENLEILKDNGIITIASEYKKIKQELKKTKQDIEYHKKMELRLISNIAKHEEILQKALIEYEDLKEKCNKYQVVVQFDPTRKKQP